MRNFLLSSWLGESKRNPKTTSAIVDICYLQELKKIMMLKLQCTSDRTFGGIAIEYLGNLFKVKWFSWSKMLLTMPRERKNHSNNAYMKTVRHKNDIIGKTTTGAQWLHFHLEGIKSYLIEPNANSKKGKPFWFLPVPEATDVPQLSISKFRGERS